MIKPNKEFKAEHGAFLYALSVMALLLAQLIAAAILGGAGFGGASDGTRVRIYRAEEILKTALGFLFQVSNFLVFYFFIKKTRAKPDYLFRPLKHARQGGKKQKGLSWISYVAGGVMGVLSLVFFALIAEEGQMALDAIGYKLSPDYVRGFIAQDILLLLVTVIAAPLCEELVYRSGLLSGLKKQFGDITCAILCGIAFSLMHMNPEQTIYQFCLGFGASMLVINCGSVIPAMIMHAVSNLIAALSIVGVGGFTHYFDWYERTLIKSSPWVFAVSTLVLTAAGFCAFIYLPRLVKLLEDRRAQKTVNTETVNTVNAHTNAENANIKNANAEGTDFDTNLSGRQKFFNKNRAIIIYAAALSVCAFMWLAILLQGLK